MEKYQADHLCLTFFFLVSISLFSKYAVLCYDWQGSKLPMYIEVELKIRNGSNPSFKADSRLHCLRIPFLIEKSKGNEPLMKGF